MPSWRTIEETLNRGGEVTFTGFGKFHVAERGARQGVQPATGETIQIAAIQASRGSPPARVSRRPSRARAIGSELSAAEPSEMKPP